MKVIVLGAGVIGVTTAWYLHRQGFDVELIDRRPDAGLEASFANAGGVCPGFAGPWAAPGMMTKALRWLFEPQAPLKWRPRLDAEQWRWLWRFARECRLERYRTNKARMQRIAHYSQRCLKELREESGIQYHQQALGVLQLFSTPQELEMADQASRVLTSFGVEHRIVDAAGVRAIEPALAHSAVSLTGGLHLPGDETGDCALFTRELARHLQQRGVRFHFNTAIAGLIRDGRRHSIIGVETDRGPIAADAAVVALGCDAARLVRPLGIRLPIYPVKGYSVTLDIANPDAAPRSAVMLESRKVMIARLGDRLRVAGIAEVADFSTRPNNKACAFVADVARALFPNAGDYRHLASWCGLRPMTPDGPGYLGKTPFAGLFLACGQGSNGWTQAAGVGRLVADAVAGRPSDIDLAGLTLARRR
ncbi:D-amino acid dehydrogenase [Brenneria populi]|uniref:D-amino acid dehydrogenase n=1 Tax=Brenneria populi TaxID=1505588 RepID=A0ABU6JKM0_9GAMM|nr:D-amino acid dehydrogenase [Brenneria populi Li et al. 2015]